MARFLVVAATLLTAALCGGAQSQETVYLIRHGEKEASGSDPQLTTAGRARAADWGEMLRFAGIDQVVTSDAARTIETGVIIAERLDVPRTSIPVAEVAGLLDLLQFDHEEDTVLVVGHAETIPSILSGLGVPEPEEVSQQDFANLFIVRPDAEEPAMIRLVMP